MSPNFFATNLRGRCLPLFLCVLAAAPRGVDAHGGAERRLWPVPIRAAVSSNFCEYREGHFHAGLDIRTFGVEGVACRASGDGYVSRMRASPDGYGKALYIQLDTGETLVYAHLAEFSPELEKALKTEQERAGRYDVDVRFGAKRFRVETGDVVAYSGSTGASAPHLHFEIRDASENPLNPMTHGFALNDAIPPTIERFRLVPLDWRGRVDGWCLPLRWDTREVAPGRYTFADTLCLRGPVGLEVEVADRLNGISGRLAPYRVELTVDGETRASITLEDFSFSQNAEVDFLYDIARIRLAKSYFVQLFASAGETLPDRVFQDGGELGLEVAADGRVHTATVTAGDFAGNTSEFTFWYTAGCRHPVSAGSAVVQTEPGIPFFVYRDFVRVPASKGAMLEALGIVGRESGPGGGALVYTASQLPRSPLVVPYTAGGKTLDAYLVALQRGRSRSVEFPDLGMRLIVGRQTVYDDLILCATPWPAANVTDDHELVPLSPPVQIGPYSATLRADMEIRLDTNGVDSTASIYRLNESKAEWVHYASTVDGHTVSTVAKRPGVYAVLSDRFGPRIERPFTAVKKSYATGKRFVELVVPVEDGGSGVDPDRTVVYLDGRQRITRWDGFTKKLFVDLRGQNIMGPRSLVVEAYDNTGNRSTIETTLEIRPPNKTQPGKQ